MRKREELERQVSELERQLEEMRERMARLEARDSSDGNAARETSRRNFLRLGAGAALGAVGLAASRVIPAAAADGATVTTGGTFTAEHPTVIQGDAATALPVIGAQANGFSSAALTSTAETLSGALQALGNDGGTTTDVEGIDGFASGTKAFGVWGLTDSGYGTVGESSTGIGLYARGSGRVLQEPRAAGVPDYTPNEMEQVRDADGTLWLSNSQGTWRRATTFEVFPGPRRVYGTGVLLPIGAVVQNIDATKQLNLTPTGVPAGAVAAWCAVQSIEPAVLSIYPAGSPDPHIGAWGQMGTAGISVQVSYMMVPLNSSGKFSFTNLKTKARIYFDVWGYLSQSA
jgi:hypothetical protein